MKNAFKDLTVSNKTFESIKDIRDLAAKFTDGVEIEKSKINDNTISGEVLSIDYQQNTFFKELHAKIQDKDKAIFELDKDKNVKYNLIDDADVKKNSKNYEKTTIIQLRELNKHQMARMKKTKKYFNQWNTCSLKQKNEVHDKSLDSKVL
nr:hypothetical protein [Mycoplasmopsis bovis]